MDRFRLDVVEGFGFQVQDGSASIEAGRFHKGPRMLGLPLWGHSCFAGDAKAGPPVGPTGVETPRFFSIGFCSRSSQDARFRVNTHLLAAG